MKVLFITIGWPKKGAANIYSDLMCEFTDRGHTVDVIMLSESRNKVSSHMDVDGNLSVIYAKCGNIQKTNKYVKVINSFLAGFSVMRSAKRFVGDKKYDLLVFALPPLTLGPFVIKLKKQYNAPLYLLLKEFWPQDPVDLNAMRMGGFVWKTFRYLEKKLYENSDYIGTMSEAGIKYLKTHNPNLKAELEVCPNSQKAIFLGKSDIKETREKYSIPIEKCVFVIGGNFGVSQGIPELIRSIREAIKKVENVFFLIIGNGTEFKKVQWALKDLGKENVGIYEAFPRNEFDKVLTACDVGVISLFPQYTVPNVPSRMISYLLAELPILAAVDKATDAGDIIENAGCGIKVINGDIDAFVESVRKLSVKSIREKMSENSRKLMIDQYSTEKAYKIIMKHFEE